jgi:hypothetical protein
VIREASQGEFKVLRLVHCKVILAALLVFFVEAVNETLALDAQG